VQSRRLGNDTIDTFGTNAGFYELATGAAVLGYYEEVLRDELLASGRVTYLPMHRYDNDGSATSLLTGERVQLTATRKVVNAHYIGSVVPSMREHTPSFVVSDSATLVSPAALSELEQSYPGYIIIGAGKTSADVCTWLLANGVDADAITWVRPRDSWFYNRAVVQPGVTFAKETFGGYANMLEAAAAATSVQDLAARYERAGVLLRIDETCEPTFYRGATMTQAEAGELRKIRDVVRMGYVRSIADGVVQLEHGTIERGAGSLFVDCTAEGLRRKPKVPVFAVGTICLQFVVNSGQACYSAALAGIVELSLESDDQKNAHLQAAPITGDLEDLARNFLTELENQLAWSSVPRIQDWVGRCRLNPAMAALASMDMSDHELVEIATRSLLGLEPARENLGRLVARF
jgi:hypothetical protein